MEEGGKKRGRKKVLLPIFVRLGPTLSMERDIIFRKMHYKM